MTTSHGGPLTTALHDLQHIFGARLLAVVGYGPGAGPAQSLAFVASITVDDLDQCAARTAGWHRAGCATPLLLTQQEFAGSLDAFPIEYGEIVETSRLLYGPDPFAGLTIRTEDLRRECETLVKSHLVHLRENYVEARGRQSEIGALVAEGAPAFALILRRLAKLDGFPVTDNNELNAFAVNRPGLDARTVGDIITVASQGPGVDAVRLFPAYLSAVEQLWMFTDQWKAAGR